MQLKDRLVRQHFYAFFTRADDHIPFFDRTFGTGFQAREWVKKDPARRFYMVNKLPYKYYY